MQIVVIIKGQTRPKKIPKDSLMHCWLVKPNVIYSAQTAVFTPQCGCQRHHIHLFNSDTLTAELDKNKNKDKLSSRHEQILEWAEH